MLYIVVQLCVSVHVSPTEFWERDKARHGALR